MLFVGVSWTGCYGGGSRGRRWGPSQGNRSVSLDRNDFRGHRNEKLGDPAARTIVDDHLNDRSNDRR